MIWLLIVLLFALIVLLVWRRPARSVFAEDLSASDVAWHGGVVSDQLVFTKLAFEAAAACKDKFGEMRNTNANRLVAGEFVRNYLRENYPDLRVVDRVKHATYAVEWALVPSPYAAHAAGFSADPGVKARRAGFPAPR